MGYASPLRRSPGSDHGVDGTLRPPNGATTPMRDVVPRRCSPGSDHRLSGIPGPPSQWDRAYRGCHRPQALSNQRLLVERDAPSPQQVGPRQWGMPSLARALKVMITA